MINIFKKIKSDNIEILPRGLITDNILELELKNNTPISLRNAKKVLIYTNKMIKKKGLFSSQKSRTVNLQNSIYTLEKSLKEEGYIPSSISHEDIINYIFGYMSIISKTYPNWREEYSRLNGFIPLIF